MPPEVTEEPIVVLPTNPTYEVKFSKTTTYHWPNFDLNITSNTSGFDATQQGPFGFGKGVELDASKDEVFKFEFRILNIEKSSVLLMMALLQTQTIVLSIPNIVLKVSL